MNVNFVRLDQSADPGFTLKVAIDCEHQVIEAYIVDNKTKIITVPSIPLEIWHAEVGMAREAHRGNFEPIRGWMDAIVTGYQCRVGWRLPV